LTQILTGNKEILVIFYFFIRVYQCPSVVRFFRLRAKARFKRRQPEVSGQAKEVVIISGKGGMGKTSLAVAREGTGE